MRELQKQVRLILCRLKTVVSSTTMLMSRQNTIRAHQLPEECGRRKAEETRHGDIDRRDARGVPVQERTTVK